MNPNRRKLLYRLGAAKQSVEPTVSPAVEVVKPVVVESVPAVVEVEAVVESAVLAEEVSVAQGFEVVESAVSASASKKSKKSS